MINVIRFINIKSWLRHELRAQLSMPSTCYFGSRVLEDLDWFIFLRIPDTTYSPIRRIILHKLQEI